MKLKSNLLIFFFSPVALWIPSCSLTQENQVSHDFENLAINAFDVVSHKFDNTKILLNSLSNKTVTATIIKKIINITTDLLEKKIPHALSALDKSKAHGVDVSILNKNILAIQQEVLRAQ